MLKFLKESNAFAVAITTGISTFLPESIFGKFILMPESSYEANIVLNRILFFIGILILSIIINALYLRFRRSIYIKGKNYSIKVEYGDLFNMHNCKKIIPFDECFTTSVGNSPSDINPDSLCGQYLSKYPIQNMQSLIECSNLKPARSKSKYQNKIRYDSGRLVQNGEYLLMAFAKLNESGIGILSRKEFLECLAVLWEEIDKYYGQKDVCIPILGSGVTRIDGTSLTQQELLDIIIWSYKLSTHKIKYPCQLHIVCKKQDNFSLNKIGENI